MNESCLTWLTSIFILLLQKVPMATWSLWLPRPNTGSLIASLFLILSPSKFESTLLERSCFWKNQCLGMFRMFNFSFKGETSWSKGGNLIFAQGNPRSIWEFLRVKIIEVCMANKIYMGKSYQLSINIVSRCRCFFFLTVVTARFEQFFRITPLA